MIASEDVPAILAGARELAAEMIVHHIPGSLDLSGERIACLRAAAFFLALARSEKAPVAQSFAVSMKGTSTHIAVDDGLKRRTRIEQLITQLMDELGED